jgi:hypothetical protein
MTTKHTPGPWRVEDITSEGKHVYWRIACPTRSVAGVSVDVPVYGDAALSRKVREEITANARLIAAAPELLEALTHVRVCSECQQTGARHCLTGRELLVNAFDKAGVL